MTQEIETKVRKNKAVELGKAFFNLDIKLGWIKKQIATRLGKRRSVSYLSRLFNENETTFVPAPEILRCLIDIFEKDIPSDLLAKYFATLSPPIPSLIDTCNSPKVELSAETRAAMGRRVLTRTWGIPTTESNDGQILPEGVDGAVFEIRDNNPNSELLVVILRKMQDPKKLDTRAHEFKDLARRDEVEADRLRKLAGIVSPIRRPRPKSHF